MFWGLLIAGIVLVVRCITDGVPVLEPQDERFARCEIDEQEFHSRPATLRSSSYATRLCRQVPSAATE